MAKALLIRQIWLNTFMRETNHLNVIFVITALLKRVTLMHMLHPFMKEKSHSNVTFVITAVLIRGT